METEVIKYFFTQSAWAVLFVWMLFDTRKENKNRENLMREEMAKRDKEATEREEKLRATIDKNQSIIQDLAKKFDVVEDIKEDVDEIKEKIFRK